MLTTRHLTVEFEVLKWFILVALAVIMMLALATALAAEPMPAPTPLPADINLLARPMPGLPFFPENPPTAEVAPAEVAAKLWMILEHERAGCYGEALAGWGQLQLPEETAVWQYLAEAVAYLQAGDHEQTIVHLDLARHLAPDQAVVAYYTGILRLEQARAATQVPDGYDAGNLRLVAFLPRHGQEAKQLYEALAMTELRHAIDRAGDIRLDQPLLGPQELGEPQVLGPRVGDLLVALGADNFIGKAHNLLFGLEFDRGQWTKAEDHLDAAVATGLVPLDGYNELAQAYLDAGQNAAAMRAEQKDLQANYPALWKACQELDAAWQRVWEGWVW